MQKLPGDAAILWYTADTIGVSPGGAPEKRMPARNMLGGKSWAFVPLTASSGFGLVPSWD